MTSIVLDEGECDFCMSESSILSCDLLYRVEDINSHYFCLLFSSGLGQRGEEGEGVKGFLPADIRKEIRRGSRLKCVFCKKKGATVGCAEPTCKKTYHLTCGSQHDCLMQYFGQFKSMCSRHRDLRTSKPRRQSNVSNCTICQQKLGAGRKIDLSIVYSDCCGGGYHRDCVQSMAISAGNTHFRCPNCADHGTWVGDMLEAGIYIPEQDASWEREDGYEELDREPVRLCHAKLCFCDHDNGRAHHSPHGLWEILKCDSCGHKGIHAKCGGMESVSEPVWHCYTCRQALRQQGQEDLILSQTSKLWDKEMTATVKMIPGLSEKLVSQGCIKQKTKVMKEAKYDYSTSFTDLLGSMLDRDDSPGDSDYESGDKNNPPPAPDVVASQ